jgi:hypothetical protein
LPIVAFVIVAMVAATIGPAAADVPTTFRVGAPLTGEEANSSLVVDRGAAAANAANDDVGGNVAASAVTNAGAIQSMDQTYAQILADHNAYRAKHQAPALVWDDAVAARAAVTANSCVFESNPQGDGENRAATVDLDVTSALAWAVETWYDTGAPFYDYSNPGFSEKTGTFTQVVWVSSSRLGRRDLRGLVSGLSVSRAQYGRWMFCIPTHASGHSRCPHGSPQTPRFNITR